MASHPIGMNRLRILASIVLLLGALYLAVGISSWLQYRNVLQTFAYYGISNDIQMSVPEIASARNRLLSGAIEFPLAGIIVLCVGVGLRFAKLWARRVWLVVVSFLTLFHIVRLCQDYQLHNQLVLLRIVEVFFIGSVAVLSWSWLHWQSGGDGPAEESRAI